MAATPEKHEGKLSRENSDSEVPNPVREKRARSIGSTDAAVQLSESENQEPKRQKLDNVANPTARQRQSTPGGSEKKKYLTKAERQRRKEQAAQVTLERNNKRMKDMEHLMKEMKKQLQDQGEQLVDLQKDLKTVTDRPSDERLAELEKQLELVLGITDKSGETTPLTEWFAKLRSELKEAQKYIHSGPKDAAEPSDSKPGNQAEKNIQRVETNLNLTLRSIQLAFASEVQKLTRIRDETLAAGEQAAKDRKEMLNSKLEMLKEKLETLELLKEVQEDAQALQKKQEKLKTSFNGL
ncbi:hypothetical protein M426DRAFT_26506 [Hypoxylon sp. CI-4A]|nr:hypothetical protein M426DRAFT_26506 [Hypoxylon sp. CI-4A]